MFDSFYLIERLDEVEKGFSGLFAEVSYVDSGNDNFFSSGQGYFPSLFGKLFDGSASASAPCERNRTIGTEVVATVLNF